jgi:LacI family transcriptional regulator
MRLTDAHNPAATMSAIADAADVSVSTVSRVMGGGKGISRQTIEKVRKIAVQSGYRPRSGSTLRAQAKKRTAGLRIGLVHWGHDQYPPHMAIQAHLHQLFIIETWRAVTDAGHLFCLDYQNQDHPNPRSAALAPGAVDGLIVKGSVQPRVLDQLPSGIPAVILRRPLGMAATHTSVNCNYTVGIARCVRYLHELGHRRIGFFCFEQQRFDDMDKIVSYQQTLQSLGLDATSYLAVWPLDEQRGSPAACADAVDSLLKLAQPPTALISSEAFCFHIAQRLKHHGLSVPGDVSLIDAVTGASSHESLRENATRLQMPARDMCRVAVEHLVRHIHHPQAPPQTVLMDMDFIVGDTTAPPPPPPPDSDPGPGPRK